MAQRTVSKERNPHSDRVIYDATEWHDRLERLADMRRELPISDPRPTTTNRPPGPQARSPGVTVTSS
jgi:hypothetical protein